MTIARHRHPGSYRDPSGSVFELGGRVFRGIRFEKKAEVVDFLASGFYRRNAGAAIVTTRQIAAGDLPDTGLDSATLDAYPLWVEHQVIDFITHPYEWSFEFLKAAAVFHLGLQIEAINAGYQIKDSSAYNIQFVGCRPVFIDTLSFEPYVEGAPWVGYKQFCESFLAPLALNAFAKVDFNAWLRGSPDGIDLVAASRLLPLRSYFSPTILGNIHAQAWAMSKIAATSAAAESKREIGKIPKRNLLHLLASLRRFVEGLKPRNASYWTDYQKNNSYSDETTRQKEDAISAFVRNHRIASLLDAGCNTGHFSEVAFKAGAKRVIGLDIDGGAVNIAASRPFFADKAFTPIQYDLTNPSPSLGWNLQERMSLDKRLPPLDGIVCLALIHHLVIGRNIPLTEFIDWAVDMAPRGVIEFVPKDDAMVAGLLAHREDVFFDYREDAFLAHLKTRAEVTQILPLTGTPRKLVFFQRN